MNAFRMYVCKYFKHCSKIASYNFFNKMHPLGMYCRTQSFFGHTGEYAYCVLEWN